MYDMDDLIPWLIVALIVALVVVVVVVDGEEQAKWEKFKVSHNCRISSHVDGEIFTTTSISSNGNPRFGIGSTSSKVGWLCDDGITYLKDERSEDFASQPNPNQWKH
jgi:hypothetical protein